MTEPRAQLTIPLTRHTQHRLENFDVGVNEELICRIRELAAGNVSPGLWIWGGGGSGRSHLLQAACHSVTSRGASARYLPLAALAPDPELLEGQPAELVALDDVDAWLGDRALETALMGLYQAQLEHRRALLVSASAPAVRFDFALADLGSRFRSLPSYGVALPDDAGLRRILTARARLQGLTLGEDVLDYWLHRVPRALPVLLDQLAELDARALAEQRRITVPLVKAVLGL